MYLGSITMSDIEAYVSNGDYTYGIGILDEAGEHLRNYRARYPNHDIKVKTGRNRTSYAIEWVITAMVKPENKDTSDEDVIVSIPLNHDLINPNVILSVLNNFGVNTEEVSSDGDDGTIRPAFENCLLYQQDVVNIANALIVAVTVGEYRSRWGTVETADV